MSTLNVANYSCYTHHLTSMLQRQYSAINIKYLIFHKELASRLVNQADSMIHKQYLIKISIIQVHIKYFMKTIIQAYIIILVSIFGITLEILEEELYYFYSHSLHICVQNITILL